MPGAGALYTLSAGLTRGRRASLWAALGCTLGIVPLMLAAITGAAALLNASAVAFQTLKWAGVAYLLVMALTTIRAKGAIAVEESAASPSPRRIVTRGVLVNVLNPKLTIFFFAFLPQFVDPQAPGAIGHMLALSVVFMAVTLVVFAGYGVFAAAVRTRVVSRPAVMSWLRRVFAGSFLALGARLALAGR